MKGVVFTEFFELVEQAFSIDVAEEMIAQSDLPTGGAYTAVGTYDHVELLRMLTRLSALTGAPVPDLVRTFGRHLFARFTVAYPALFEGVPSAFHFLDSVEDHIHVEVRKLYPDAALPTFDTRILDDGRMEMIYRSTRPLADLAEGLIAGCAEYFGEQIAIHREPLPGETGAVRFLLLPLPKGESEGVAQVLPLTKGELEGVPNVHHGGALPCST